MESVFDLPNLFYVTWISYSIFLDQNVNILKPNVFVPDYYKNHCSQWLFSKGNEKRLFKRSSVAHKWIKFLILFWN